MIRQPLGVVAAITPFNFPGMIPFWFLPYAVAAGNCFILKPSERVPVTSWKLFHLMEKAGFPPGVIQLVNGGREAVDALLDHPAIRAVSFVGSTATARYIYSRAAANGKRAQCQGGAKNPVVVMPDADMEMTTRILVDGRNRKIAGFEDGFFVSPTVLDQVPPDAETARTEIFGPVLSLMHAKTIEEAIALVNGRSYGNMACIFTTDGANARRFRYEVNAGNVGINVGVDAPMSSFPFSGWGESFFGD